MRKRTLHQFIGLIVACAVCSVLGASGIKIAEVISSEDLEAEIAAKMTELETAVASQESYQSVRGKLHLSVAQLALFAQAIAESERESNLKPAAPSIRDAALRFGQAGTWEESKSRFANIKFAIEGTLDPVATAEYDWSKIARIRTLMDCLRDRTDQVRKSMRRTKDPLTESRHAAAMAVLGVALSAHAEAIPTAENHRQMWQDWSLELQREMTKTAGSIRNRNPTEVLEHFKSAQTACDHCHEKFKK